MAKKTEQVKDDSCGCGCADCHCDKDCKGCGCGKKWVKPMVTFASALIIAGSILTVGMCPCGKTPGKPAMPAPMMGDNAVREYIMKNPKVIIDSVDAYYRAQQKGGAGDEGCGPAPEEGAKPAKPAAPREMTVAPKDLVDAIVADKTNMVLGNKKGNFVIIEFFDYQCGWCKKTNAGMADAVKKAPNIRWILIDSPIFGPDSERIALYAMAADKQGKFAEYHDAIGKAQGKLDEAALIKIGTDLKLDTAKLKKDAEGQELKAKLAKNRDIAQKLNVRGVPMMIVDGKINPGALFGPALDEVVKQANARK